MDEALSTSLTYSYAILFFHTPDYRCPLISAKATIMTTQIQCHGTPANRLPSQLVQHSFNRL